jgi:hypothetical protein
MTSLLAVITLSRGVAAAAAAAGGVLIAMYLFNIVAQVQPDFAWLGDLSAFRYAGVGALIHRGTADWVGIGVLAIAAVAGWTASLVLFRRRDLLP